jgi:hypothetical protein
MPGALRCIKVGDALAVHRQDADVAELAAYAAALAPDPSHVVLVLGSGADHPGEDWAPLLPALVAAARDVRLVPGTASATTSVKLGRWLAPQLGKAVLAYDGVALPAPRGALFVPSANGTGWVRCGSGQEPSSGSRRFPSPGWSCAILEHDMLTEAAVAEPLPGGAWIRSQIAADIDRQRQRLISRLDRSDEHAYVVLGSSDAPPVAAADVQAFWRLLPPGTRAAIRFVSYGPVAVPDGQSLDQALAEWLGERVTVCPQTPWSTEEPEPSVLRKGRAPDPDAVPPMPESVFPKPEMISPEPFSRPLAHEAGPGSEARADDNTMPLPVVRVPEEPPSPDRAPGPDPAPARASAPAPALATPSPTADSPADGLRRRNSPRRMLRGMRWPAVAAVACLAIAVPVSVIALQSSAGPARVLAAPGPSLTPASQTMTPTVSPSSSATSRGLARSTALTEDQPSQGTATQAARSSKVSGAPTVTGSSSPQGSTGTSNSNGSSSGGSSSPEFGSAGSGSGGFGADGSGFGSGGSGSNGNGSGGNGSGGGGTSGSGSSGSGSSGSGSVGSSSGTASNPTPTQTQTAPASTNACAVAWDSTSVYVAGDEVSDNGDNWTANQWNDDEAPGGAAGAWNDDGTC